MVASGASLTKSVSNHQARTIAKETFRYWVWHQHNTRYGSASPSTWFACRLLL